MRLIKLQSFSTAKEINDMKIQPIILDEKTSVNDATNNVLISKIYKQLIQINIKKTNKSKIGRRFKQTFLWRRHGQEACEKMLNVAKY